MSLLSLIAVFLLEQLQPLDYRRIVAEPLSTWADFVESQFNAGAFRHGLLAWCLAVLLPVALVGGVYAALYALNPLFGLLLNIGVLYLTMGFRQFSHHYTEIQLALREEDLSRARQLLETWQGRSAYNLGSSAIARLSIEGALAASHRHVFGVLAWFSVCAALGLGPAGAVVFRMSEFVARHWQRASQQPASAALQRVSQEAWTVLNWLPARLTAMSFAIVGNFEEAIEGWRFHAQNFPNDNDGVLLAATAGAINVRLGGEALRPREAGDSGWPSDGDLDSGVTPGRPAEVGHLRSVVGLVWRAVVVWMLLLALLTLARLLG